MVTVQAAVRGWMDSVFERGGAAAAIHRQQMAAMTAKVIEKFRKQNLQVVCVAF